MEKKGEYVNPGFGFLKSASERELFYLNRGLTVSAAREVVVQVMTLEETSLKYYVEDQEDSLRTWIKNMIKDKKLYLELKNKKTKETITETILNRISELDVVKLKKFGVSAQKEKILTTEKYITSSLKRGIPYFVIRADLISKGWSSKVVDIILESDTYNYRNFTSLNNVFEINAAYQKFEELKKKIMVGIAEGLPLKEIIEYFKNTGWSNNIIEYLLQNVYKPSNNLTKLYWYIIKEMSDNNKNLSEVKAYIIKTGWPSYIVDNLINRFNTFEDDLDILLDYLKTFDSEEKVRTKSFLKSQGWDEALIDRAITNRETKKFWNQMTESLNLENDSSLRYNTEIFKKNILKLKNTTNAHAFWKEIMNDYKRTDLKDFIDTEGELHSEKEYIYYYKKSDLAHLLEVTKKGLLNKLFKNTGTAFYYSEPIKPLLCDLNKNKFLVAPRIIHRECVSCKIKFPINKMTKIEMWDASRTHKVTRYVCKQHEDMINTLIDENKFVQ